MEFTGFDHTVSKMKRESSVRSLYRLLMSKLEVLISDYCGKYSSSLVTHGLVCVCLDCGRLCARVCANKEGIVGKRE